MATGELMNGLERVGLVCCSSMISSRYIRFCVVVEVCGCWWVPAACSGRVSCIEVSGCTVVGADDLVFGGLLAEALGVDGLPFDFSKLMGMAEGFFRLGRLFL